MAITQRKTLPLPSRLDAETATPLQQALIAYADNQAELRLDGSDVEQLTTPYMQLLVSFLRTPARANCSSIFNASPALRAAWGDFGLNDSLPLE